MVIYQSWEIMDTRSLPQTDKQQQSLPRSPSLPNEHAPNEIAWPMAINHIRRSAPDRTGPILSDKPISGVCETTKKSKNTSLCSTFITSEMEIWTSCFESRHIFPNVAPVWFWEKEAPQKVGTTNGWGLIVSVQRQSISTRRTCFAGAPLMMVGTYFVWCLLENWSILCFRKIEKLKSII